MHQVIFKIDAQKEYEYHQLFLRNTGWVNFSLFAYTSIENKQRIIRKIESFWDDEDKKIIGKIEEQWREIENDYFRLIKEIVGIDWLYENYYVYILAFYKKIGFSNPFNQKSQEIILTTGAITNPRFLLGHELFHSHFYYIIDKLGMPQLRRTLFVEGIAALVLSDPKLNKLFATINFNRTIDSFPEVILHWPTLQELWNKRINFESFLVEADKKLNNNDSLTS